MASRSTVCSALSEHSSYLFVLHRHADIDTVGAAIGFRDALEGSSRIVAPDGVQTQARGLLEELEVKLYEPTEVNVVAADCLVIVDAPSTDRIAPVSPESAAGDVVVIDHHERGDLVDVATAAYVDTEAGATATLVARLVDTLGRELSSNAGVALAAGLLDDTESLATATAEEWTIFARLLDAASDHVAVLHRVLNKEPSFGQRVAATKAVSRSTGYRADQALLLMTEVRGEQSAAATALRASGADIALVFSDRESQTWVVGRANPDQVHLPDDVFTPLVDEYEGDGGGHAGSGVAKLETAAIDDVRERALEHLEAALDKTFSQLS